MYYHSSVATVVCFILDKVISLLFDNMLTITKYYQNIY